MAKPVLNKVGKVRHQTPKVEKLDNKVKKAPRVQKRMKYKRRLAGGLFTGTKMRMNQQGVQKVSN